MDDNRKLAGQLKKHSESALEKIIQKFTPLVAAIVKNIAKDSLTTQDIEEVTMDTFVTLWKNAEKIREDSLKAYLCCIAKTKTYDKLDTLKRAVMIDIDDAEIEDDFSIADNTEQKEINNVLNEILSEIREPDREIVIRHYFYYQKLSKIAEIMQINPETIKVKLFRARAKMKKSLTERGYAK